MAQKTLKGTTLKMAVGFSFPADPTVTLDNINWETEWYTSRYSKAQKLAKSEHTKETTTINGVASSAWYAEVNTGQLGPGILKMRLKASISGRVEYAEIETNVMII